jgi:protein disulfide-isomerase
MGRARRFLTVFGLFFLVQRAAIGQQPIHWEASIDSAKATAGQSNRLVLLLFSAPWCTACHHLENDIRNQPGAVAALEANFVLVKINYDYFPNTAKQYGVTRLPTTVILAPNAHGDVLAVIPEYMPVDEYLPKLNRVAADAKHHDAGIYAQIQASPVIGAPAVLPQPPNLPPTSPVDPIAPPQIAAPTRSPLVPASPTLLDKPYASNGAGPNVGGAAMPINAAAGPTVNTTTPSGLPSSRALDPPKPVVNAKLPVNVLFGLDGFCPVQLVENSRWQPGKKAWGAVHRGRTYLFTGPDEQRRFLANPDHYAPVGSGDDMVLLLEQGRSVIGHREHGLQFDGHVYLFANEATLEKFRSNPRYYAERALQALRPTSQTAAVR